MITDSHLHLFTDEQAAALAAATPSASGLIGTLAEVHALFERGRISRILALTTAISEVVRRAVRAQWPVELADSERRRREDDLETQLLEQVRQQNAWIASVADRDERLTVAVAADPTVDTGAMHDDVDDHMRRTPGVRAIKVHPGIAFTFPDAPGFLPIYALAQEAKVPVISHGGTHLAAFYASDVDYCAPDKFVPVLTAFRELKVIIAHLAHPYYEQLAELMESFPNAYTDLSFVLGARFLSEDRLLQLVRRIGVERVLFGSDSPAYQPVESLDYLAGTGFTAQELEAITSSNAEAVFFGR